MEYLALLELEFGSDFIWEHVTYKEMIAYWVYAVKTY